MCKKICTLGKRIFLMKLFIVNVNDCLSLSQYEPFFYEHISKKQIAMIDEISDTCELSSSCDRILAEINQHPFTIEEGAVFVFIPRTFSRNLKIQDYEVYNDINAYMNLHLRLNDSFKIYTFYVDRTDKWEASDAIYNRLQEVSDNLTTKNAYLNQFIPDLSTDSSAELNYKLFLQEKISALSDFTRNFFELVLSPMPDIVKDSIVFQNGINEFVSNCKGHLAKINHIYAPIVRDDVSEDIEDMLKVIYFIKELTNDDITLHNVPDYKNFPSPNYTHVKRLLSTYRCRLSKWYHEGNPISQKGTFIPYSLIPRVSSEGAFNSEINRIVAEQLKALRVDNCIKLNLVHEVFKKLDTIVSEAKEKLQIFAYNQSKDLFDPNNFRKGNPEEFVLSDPPAEDELAEKNQLEALNHYSHHNLPTFADENRLAQDLEILNDEIHRIIDRLKVYKIKSFLITLGISFLSVVVFYFWAQNSIFTKENSWPIFLGYLAVVLSLFFTSYAIVKRKYLRQIAQILLDCKHMVENYLDEFKKIAQEFEHNSIELQKLYCLRMVLDQKTEARKNYHETVSRYSWHKLKVAEILKNLSFFDYFINDAQPYVENSVTIDSYDHDAEHTEFYQLKVF